MSAHVMSKASLTKAEISAKLYYKYVEGSFAQCQYNKTIVADVLYVLCGTYALPSHESLTKFTVPNRNSSRVLKSSRAVIGYRHTTMLLCSEPGLPDRLLL